MIPSPGGGRDGAGGRPGGPGGPGGPVPGQAGGEEDGGSLRLQSGRELGESEMRDEAGAGVCVATLPVVPGEGWPGQLRHRGPLPLRRPGLQAAALQHHLPGEAGPHWALLGVAR